MKPNDFKKKREDLGYTQTELGETLGLHYHQVWRYEKGVTPIPKSIEMALTVIPRKKKK